MRQKWSHRRFNWAITMWQAVYEVPSTLISNNFASWVLILFYRWENWSSERMKGLHKPGCFCWAENHGLLTCNEEILWVFFVYNTFLILEKRTWKIIFPPASASSQISAIQQISKWVIFTHFPRLESKKTSHYFNMWRVSTWDLTLPTSIKCMYIQHLLTV